MKSKKGIYKGFGIAMFIIASSFLVYIHDFEIFKGMEGFSGFSSLRIGVFFVGMFTLSLTGWVFAFINSKRKNYRFAMLAPIFMLAYQLGVYLFDARNTTTNEFSTKILSNTIFIILITAAYFYGKSKSNNE